MIVRIVFLECDGTDLSLAIVKGSGADGNDASGHKDSPLFDHVGLQIDNNVIEAGFYTGVVSTSYEAFIERAPGYLALELPCEIDAEGAARRAVGFLGLGYNYQFTRGIQSAKPVLYCSELIRESCLRNDGSYFFNEVPLNFCDSLGEPLPYWAAHYQRLGTQIPQGFPGTSPLSIYRDLMQSLISRSMLI